MSVYRSNKNETLCLLGAMLVLAGSVFLGCQKSSKKVQIDGSSTVYPITEAVAEEYLRERSRVRVTVGVSGTGGGFKKFCAGEIDMSDASRHIQKEEIERCKSKGIEYIELPVAYDGLTVIVNKENNFVKEMSVADLKKIFRYEKAAKLWSELRPNWPKKKIKVYSPGQDSGTHDYFVEKILGKDSRIRSDCAFSEDDNVLVRGVAGDSSSLGFFGLAYYIENQDKLKLVPIINPKTRRAVSPNLKTVQDASYTPLSRFLFLYVSKKALQRPEVLHFANFYMEKAAKLSKDVGYIPLRKSMYEANKNKIAAAVQ